MTSFHHTKAYGQSTLLYASSTHLWATSSRVWKWAWWGCAHTAVRPKTLLNPMVRLSTIKRNAMSHWGFPTLPHTLPGRGHSVVPTWSLTPGNFSPPDKSFVTPTLLLSPVPTNWHLWRGQWNHSELSAMKEKGSVSIPEVVPKCLGEMLAVVPRCLP